MKNNINNNQDMIEFLDAYINLQDIKDHAFYKQMQEDSNINFIINRKKMIEAQREKADVLTKIKMLDDIRNQRTLEQAELRRVLFEVKPSPLMQRVRTYNSNYITLKVNENEVDLVNAPVQIVVEDIQEGDLTLEGLDYIENKMNRAIVNAIEKEILNALATTKFDDMSAAITSLSDDSQRTATFVMNLNNYVNGIETFSKLDTIIVPTQNNYVVDLSKVAVNYVVDKMLLDKDVKKGTYIAGCTIRNLKALVLELGAVASW